MVRSTKGVDPESRDRLAASVEEEVLLRRTVVRQGAQLAYRRRPHRALATLTSLAEDVDARVIKMQVASRQLRRLVARAPVL